MSPSWNGSCSGSFASRKARARSGSPYPRRTSTLAVTGLSSSSLASESTCSRGAGLRSVQRSFGTGSPPYGGRRTELGDGEGDPLRHAEGVGIDAEQLSDARVGDPDRAAREHDGLGIHAMRDLTAGPVVRSLLD